MRSWNLSLQDVIENARLDNDLCPKCGNNGAQTVIQPAAESDFTPVWVCVYCGYQFGSSGNETHPFRWPTFEEWT